MDQEVRSEARAGKMSARTGPGEASSGDGRLFDRLLPAVTESPQQTIALGHRLAPAFRPGQIVALLGELGSGKTHFVKGVAGELGASEADVSSPTFTIAHEYDTAPPVYHLDLYRLDGPEDVRAAGLLDYMGSDGICLIEWPERAGSLLPADTIVLRLSHAGGERRRIEHVLLPDHGEEGTPDAPDAEDAR